MYVDEKECIKPGAGDGDLWIDIWEELHESRGILVEVAQRFVTAGNEKADELAKAGAKLDEGFMAEVRADTMKQERGGVRSFAACSQLSLLSRTMEGL